MASKTKAAQVANTIPLDDKSGSTVAVVVEPQSGQIQKEVPNISSRLSGLVENPLVTGDQSLADSYGSLAYLQSDDLPSMSTSQADALITRNDGKRNYLRVVESNNQLVRQGIKTATSFVKVEEAAWEFGGAVVAAQETKAETLHKEEMHHLNNHHRATVRETAGYRNQRAESVRDKAKAKVGVKEDIKF